MPLTFKNIQDLVLDMIDVDDATTRDYVKKFINMTGQDIWKARPWPERYDEAEIRTVAPHTTGTVSVAIGSDAVTGTSTSFPTSIVNFETKFALSFGDPWYIIKQRHSTTSLTLDVAYAEATGSGKSYVVYQDVYSLAADVDELVDVRLLKANDDGSITDLLEKRMDEAVYIPGHSGVPGVYSMVDGHGDGSHIRIWPVPDNIYRLRYKYLKAYTDMSADADESVIPESRRDLLICGTLRHAYRLKDEYPKAEAEEARFARMLEEHWRNEKNKAGVSARLARFDRRIMPRDPFDISTIGIQ